MKKSDKIIIILLLILIFTYIFLKIFTNRSEIILIEYSKRKSINIISTMINESINEVLRNNYDNLINIEKNSNDEIVSIDFDNIELNNILYDFNNNILNKINNLQIKNDIYYVPSGIIHNIPAIVNIGPKIPFKISILGDTNNNIYTNIKDYGINNSIIEVGIKINIDLQIILPFITKTISVDKNIILDSKIIQGNIPDYYGGLNYLLNKE